MKEVSESSWEHSPEEGLTLPRMGAARGDSAGTSQGSESEVGWDVGLSSRRRLQELTLCSGFAKR